jgi:hypothetical protein
MLLGTATLDLGLTPNREPQTNSATLTEIEPVRICPKTIPEITETKSLITHSLLVFPPNYLLH